MTEQRKSRLKGCLLTCAVLFTVFILICIGMVYWLFKKGRFDPELSILDAQTTTYVRAYLTEDDEILTAFFLQRFRDLQANSPGSNQLPDVFRDLQEWKTRRDIRKNLPLEFELAGNFDEETFRGALSYSRYANLIRISYGFFERALPESEKGTYGEYEYVKIQPDSMDSSGTGSTRSDTMHLDLVDTVFYFAVTEPDMHRNYDAVNGPIFQHPALAQVDTTAPIYGFLEKAAITKMLVAEGMTADESEIPTLMSAMTRMTFSARATDQDTLVLNMNVTIPPSPAARADIDHLVDLIISDLNIEVTTDVVENPSGYVVTLTMTNFAAASGELMNP